MYSVCNSRHTYLRVRSIQWSSYHLSGVGGNDPGAMLMEPVGVVPAAGPLSQV